MLVFFANITSFSLKAQSFLFGEANNFKQFSIFGLVETRLQGQSLHRAQRNFKKWGTRLCPAQPRSQSKGATQGEWLVCPRWGAWFNPCTKATEAAWVLPSPVRKGQMYLKATAFYDTLRLTAIGLRNFCQFGKGIHVTHSNISQNFTVNSDVRFVQAIDKAAV